MDFDVVSRNKLKCIIMIWRWKKSFLKAVSSFYSHDVSLLKNHQISTTDAMFHEKQSENIVFGLLGAILNIAEERCFDFTFQLYIIKHTSLLTPIIFSTLNLTLIGETTDFMRFLETEKASRYENGKLVFSWPAKRDDLHLLGWQPWHLQFVRSPNFDFFSRLLGQKEPAKAECA